MNLGTETYATCCGTPLVSTMIFSGAEFYCIKCASTYGIFGVPNRAEKTEALTKAYDKNRQLLYKIAANFIPHNCYINSCDKCENGPEGRKHGYHHQHATDEQRKLSDAAYQVLLAGNLKNE